MKKVGILTCFLDNQGACLQAFALQESIVNLGYDCSIVPFIEPDGYYIPSKMEKVRKLKAKLTKNKGAYSVYKWKEAFIKFRKKFLKFEKRNGKVKYYSTYTELENTPLQYDAYVCGSDQIWNPSFYQRNNPAYFLQFAKEKVTVAYAPSIGLSQLPEKYQSEFKKYCLSLDSISVREEAGANIIKNVCGVETSCPVVVDPTLLHNGDFWAKITQKPKKIPFKKYIFCYLFSNTDTCKTYLTKLQQETDLPIIYFPVSELDYQGLNAVCVSNSGPCEFLWLIQNAEAVVTDSFHASVFSLQFHKKFIVSKRERKGEDSMESRLINLLNMAGLKDGMCCWESASTNLKNIYIDYEDVERCLQEKRNEGLNYLKNALEKTYENN